MKAEVISVTPQMAEDWLTKSKGNRGISDNLVLAYAQAMTSGLWLETGEGIKFTEDGVLVDGHHRLTALTLCDNPVRMLVVKGVDPKAAEAIDTGRSRSLRDQARMFRPDMDRSKHRITWTRVCIELLTGVAIKIPNLAALDEWSPHFRPGIEAMLEIIPVNSRSLSSGYVGGSLAFAHKLSPDKISEFTRRISSMANLREGSPEIGAMRLITGVVGRVYHGQDRTVNAKKILNAAKAFVESRGLEKLYDSSLGLDFFRNAYASRKLLELCKPWSDRAACAMR